jgi:hypothetical protein
MANRTAHLLSTVLCVLMCGQSILGLLYTNQYRDADWITASWFGNDLVTLVVAVTLLVIAPANAARSSARAWLIRVGVLGYAIYNYAFYLFGAALNVFFLFYVGAFIVAVAALIVGLTYVDPAEIAAAFRPSTPVRLIGGSLMSIALGLAAIWIAMWAAYVFAGKQLPIEPEPFRVVAALDLTLMVPALLGGGLLLWRKSPWGYIAASAASIQGSLYLLVLSVGSCVAILRGLVVAPGELPIWMPLATIMMALSITLLSRCTERHR